MTSTLETIHDASLAILKNTGMIFHAPEAVDILHKKGCIVEGNRVFFPENVLMDLISSAPESFTLFARNPAFSIEIGTGTPTYSVGYGCPSIIERDGTKRNANFDDYLNFVKLIQGIDNLRINGGIPAQPNDIDMETCSLLMVATALLYSDKCIMAQPGSRQQVEEMFNLAALTSGGMTQMRKEPRIITLINTLTPLQMDAHAVDTLMVHAENGQPIVICSGFMQGTTAPMTMAGSMALGNAETLAGVALTQAIRPGTPVVMAINGSPANMRTGALDIGSPAHAIEVKCCAALSKKYGIPCRCGGTSTDAKSVTAQAGYEAMMTMQTSMESGVDLIIHSAGILNSYAAMSYEKFMLDLEIISKLEYIAAGIPINDKTLALGVIDTVGPGGQYLTHMHTMENCRIEPWQSPIESLVKQESNEGDNDFLIRNLKANVDKRIAAYERPVLPEETVTYIKNFLREKGVPEQDIKRLN
ncbi:trimethylamine methyltransferase family protein [Desulforhopalus singaporensis]|uniref:Trimethylamine---corrinoid protein Co-methyltransferase n=1 Tax=Desulforhopalus singaporensis TaxID=91360 RepID=A0A1H0R7Z6_9BACT|nr:trimethylamine methyltransferase family protein [Desulforhopalus singaporensis]SDP25176.1 trimethylamine---corrinoid protein Co-methyltransferase [Desulforhopalus singaporensis]